MTQPLKAATRSPRLGVYEGEQAVFVPLQTGDEAITTPEAYQALVLAGFIGAWWYSSVKKGGYRYVETECLGLPRNVTRTRSVAALIAGAADDEQAVYRNGNHLDLRPCNLELHPRRGRRGHLQGPPAVDYAGAHGDQW